MKTGLSQNKSVGKLASIILVLSFLLIAFPLSGHEIPERVQVKMLIHEDGQTLKLFVRLPLEAMRDVDFSLRGPGYLNFTESMPLIRDAVNLWVLDEIKLYQGDTRLTSTEKEEVKISLPSNMAFNSYDEVLPHFSSPPLSDDIDLFWRQANVDVLVTYPLEGDDQSFSMEPRLSGLGLRTVSAVTFTPRDGSRYQYDFDGDPGLLNLNPDWLQVINRFVGRGFLHILSGLDHLLFLVALIAPITKVRPLIYVITAFTLGHSLTLAIAVLGYIPDSLWFPVSIELLVALTILFLAIDNIFMREKKIRWAYGLLFGLIHGLAFSFALSQSLQYSGNHLVVGLLGFNLGVEFGQLLVLAIVLPLFVLLRRLIQRERLMLGLVSLYISHTSLHWIQDRWEILSGYF
jgi:hypothetical protein